MNVAAMSGSTISEAVKKFAPLMFGFGALVGGALAIELPPWAVKSLEQWGPAAAIMLLILWYVPRDSIKDFILAQQAQAVAMTSVAENIKALPQKDHMKFEEVLIGQEMLHRSLDRVHARLDGLVKDIDGAH